MHVDRTIISPVVEERRTYVGHVKFVCYAEAILLIISSVGVVWNSEQFPREYVIPFVGVSAFVGALLIMWLCIANISENIHSLIAWYVLHAILFSFISFVAVLNYMRGYREKAGLLFIVAAIYRIYSIYVVRSRANEIIKELKAIRLSYANNI